MTSLGKIQTSRTLRSHAIALLLILLLASNLAVAGDEFHGVVSSIEDHYGVHHMHIPLLGVALFFVRPEGISGLKLAVFENFHHSDIDHSDADDNDVRRVVEQSLSSDWRLFVRTHSRHDREDTLIYTNLSSGKMQMLVINLEPDEATIVQMKLSDRALKRWMRDPGERVHNEFGHGHHSNDD
jgi:hypothetical protein